MNPIIKIVISKVTSLMDRLDSELANGHTDMARQTLSKLRLTLTEILKWIK